MPSAENAVRIACPPYDVLSKGEAQQIAATSDQSFVGVIRPEIDDSITNPYSDSAYAAAKNNLDNAVSTGSLAVQEPGIYLYRQVIGAHAQTGVVCCYDVDQYRAGKIKKHEKTRPDKEDDRVRHMLACSAHPEPVLLTFVSNPQINQLIATEASNSTCFDFVAEDGVRHMGWRVSEADAFVKAFEQVDAGYIADGHHRTAAADRASTKWRSEHLGDDHFECDRVLSVFFPVDQLRILAYNRVASFPDGMNVESFREKLNQVGQVEPTAEKVPSNRGNICCYFDGQWHRLQFQSDSIPNDTIGSLDVSLLQDKVLAPLLEVDDPRTHPGIQFVGGTRGTDALELFVNSGKGDVAFSMYPTSIEDLIQVSDEGNVMPPKSTWFDPKLLSGLFVHPF